MSISKGEEQVTGFKSTDFRGAEEVVGGDARDLRMAELPEGIRFYIRNQPVDLGSSNRIEFLIYELFPVENGMKLRRRFLEKVFNKIPDDAYIADRFGANEHGYQWQAKWIDNNGQEKGVLSAFIYVSDRGVRAAAPVPAPLSLPPAAPAGGFSVQDVFKMMGDAEERAIRNMERMAQVIKANQSADAGAVMEKAMDAVGKMFGASVESQVGMMKKVQKMNQDRMEDMLHEGDEDEEVGEVEPERDSGLPVWLKPFMPKIEEAMGHLLGGGPVGSAVKGMILSSEQWKEIFGDSVKWGQFVDAAKAQFGEEKTEQALKILLNKREPKKVKGSAGK